MNDTFTHAQKKYSLYSLMTFDELLDTYELRLAAAVREGIEAIRSSIILARVVERLERGDINDAMQIDPEAFSALEIALAEAFNAGGVNAVGEFPAVKDPQGNRVIWRFGVRNPVAEGIPRDLSSTLVTHVTEDQKQGIRRTKCPPTIAG